MQPPTLRIAAQTTIIRTLVCSPDNCNHRRHLVELFRGTEGSFLSEEILSLIIKRFPQWLTDELLYVLAPQHMKRLKLKDCSLVTCEGLIKTIVRCSHLNQLDFTGCVKLLHPTVFCCLKDFAPHITHLMFEECEVMTDDIVQIILMCCPKLEHLNISSCKNITDNAFALGNNTNRLSQRAQLAGRHLTSIDISGCQSLTSTAIRHLVALSGPTLTSVNIAWTGVGCIALLYLAGLSLEAAIQFVQKADSSCLGLIQSNLVSQESGGCSSKNYNNSEFLNNNETSENSNTEHFKSIIEDETNGKPYLSVEMSPQQQQTVETIDTAYEQTLREQEKSSEEKFSIAVTNISVDYNSFDTASSSVTFSNKDTKEQLSKNHSCNISCSEQDEDHLIKDETLLDQHTVECEILQNKCESTSTGEIHSIPCASLPEHPFKEDTIKHTKSSSLDEKWRLAWQHINDDDKSHDDDDELFDIMWGDEPIGVDSVSSAFGHGISCLTSALVNLDLCDTIENSDGDDDDDNDDDDYNMDISIKPLTKTENDSLLTVGVPSKDNHDDINNHMGRAEQNVQYNKPLDDFGLTKSQTSKLESDAGLPSPSRCQSNCSISSSLITEDMQPVEASSNVSKQEEKENYHTQNSTTNTKSNSTIASCINENNFDNHDDDEASLDDADQLLAAIFDVHEQSCYDSYSPLHGFNDALTSLTNAMVGLINSDGDDDHDDDDDNTDDDDDDDNIKYHATEGEELLVGHQCYNGNSGSIYPNNNCSSDQNGDDQKNHTQSQENDDHHNSDFEFDSESNNGSELCKVQSLNSITMEGVNLVLLPSELEEDSHPDLFESASSRNTEQAVCRPQNEEEMMEDQSMLGNNDSNSLKKNRSSNPAINPSLDTISNPENSTKISENIDSLNLTHKPRLHTIDISNIYFHSKPLGVACLKIFTAMNKVLHSFATSWTELDDDTLLGIVKNEPELHSLSLIDCEKITDRCLMSLPLYCPRLEKIDIKGVPFITDIGVVSMLTLPCIQSLLIPETSVTDISMFSIAEKCGEKLRELDLSWCEDVTDKGLSAMATSCTSLHSLGLRQCAASFVTMETLSRYCTGLTSLNFAGLDHLTDQMLSTMTTSMPNLTVVDLSWNSSLTSIGVSALMINCSRLEEAVLNGLKALTSKPFLPIISDLPSWKAKQDIMMHRKKLNGSAESLIRPCPMEMTKSLGEELPFRSTTYCPVLRYLDLVYSDKVNDDHLSQIVAICRGTITIRDYYSRLMEPKWIFVL